ncbi:DUF305 domain-containing protein [Pengzhenrongella frigida]|uniref:DUF305 domain-containing protein n=1 Tax=Pengzhenrongella frigida TaxID=1259133 RepID=A0A4Q5N5N1_9MICO|nr:DUF305 domain-containing protein [Cellulomonas sp. HLT2-17]RYV52147.1 DUF305 domain-containing protein [Cellulomonas sp. HLT2-17]
MNLTTRTSVLGGILVLAVTLSGCASQGGEPAASAGSMSASAPTAPTSGIEDAHNDVDVEFTQNMVVHHEGAIVMADLAARVAGAPEVKALGERIAAAQEPEILDMTSWLVAWGEQSAADVDMDGMDMGGMDMGGLSQDEAMADLTAATGEGFDRRFLELMIEHHRGAIEMADAELASGSSPQALALARAIIEAQNAEITEMEQLLQAR